VVIVRSLSSNFKNQELAYIGIGKHSAIALSKAGWNVVLIARRELELQEAAAQCPNPVLILAGDITDEYFVRHAFEKAKSHFGRYLNTCIVGSPYYEYCC
jgi:NAD(P)-dependent dehydrogenase (short-subunit alcohol dehydrogenase family)